MVKFKRYDYSKKEIGEMPFEVQWLYGRHLLNKTDMHNIAEECKFKHPEYFI